MPQSALRTARRALNAYKRTPTRKLEKYIAEVEIRISLVEASYNHVIEIGEEAEVIAENTELMAELVKRDTSWEDAVQALRNGKK